MKLSMNELLIILAIVLLIFGPTQLPKLSRMFGKSVKSFRDSVKDSEDTTDETNPEKVEQ
jgi:sec-independent protein translocase protein TatA